MEKLSSGLRINRAGDDAAGLAISEKMRGQIRGLTQAQRNAQDAISLIQTAEGALNETHSILQRMRELATQSASDTNTKVDRGEIQKEIDQLAAELTRIADTTEFNTQNLLGGGFSGTFHIGANQGQNLSLTINDMRSSALGVAGNDGVGFEITSTGAATSAVAGGATFNVVKFDPVDIDDNATSPNTIASVQYGLADNDGNIVAVSADGKSYWALTAPTAVDQLAAATIAGDTGNDNAFAFADPVTSGTVTSNEDGTALTGTSSIQFASKGIALASGTYTVVDQTHTLVANGEYGLVNQAGDLVGYSTDGTAWTTLAGDALFVSGTALNTAGTKITVSSDGGIDVSSQAAADAAITTINDAIERVSAERSMLGALQNRLEHTIANLGTSAENLQAAESRIRDVDMAAEMMAFTKFQILQQASTAMLAQANMAPQSVLQLLG